jgi:hypothetical protein
MAIVNETRQRDGWLHYAVGKPMERTRIAETCGVTIDELNCALEEYLNDKNKDGTARIQIKEDGDIFLTNWELYQSKPNKEIAKETAKANGKKNKKSTLNALKAMTRAINNLTIATQKLDGKIRYIPNPSNPHNEVVDIADGTVYMIEQEIIDKTIASSIASQSDDKGE